MSSSSIHHVAPEVATAQIVEIECEHKIIEDLIDLTPTRSKYVYYCETCFKCFVDISGNTRNTILSYDGN